MWQDIASGTVRFRSGTYTISTATNDPADKSISLSPNPATDFIDVLSSDVEIRSIKIFNSVGNQILETNQNRIQLHTFPAGFYYMAIVLNDNQSLTKAFIKL